MNILYTLAYFSGLIISLGVAVNSLRNRFLPIAAPLSVFSGLMFFTCLVQLYCHMFLSTSGEQSEELLKYLNSIASTLFAPIWVQCILEYKDGKKQSYTNFWWFYIVLVAVAILSIFYVILTDDFTLFSSDLYLWFQNFYFRLSVLFVWVGIFCWTIYKIGINSISGYLFYLSLSLPIVLVALYWQDIIEKPIAAPAMIFILLWAAKQSSLLDVVPLATSGVLSRVKAGVLVFNAQKKLAYSNTFAQEVLINSNEGREVFSSKHLKAEFSISELPHSIGKAFDFESKINQEAIIELDIACNEQSNNSHCFFDASLTPIVNPKTEQWLGHILLLQDVTERELASQSLVLSNNKLVELDERKSRFFAGISHEFRTPLTLSIGELTDTLGGYYGELPSKFRPVLENVISNNRHLLRFVGQLLELSKLDQDHSGYHPELIDLNDVLSRVISNFESFATVQRISISVDLGNAPVEIWFDLDALEKVLMNLLSNALKSIDQNQGGSVTFTLKDVGDSFSLSIKDTGYGMSDDVLPHIFKAFYYNEKTHERWPSGTGVGLHIAERILNAHRASIKVQSDFGIGSEFTIDFLKGNDHLAAIMTSKGNAQQGTTANHNDYQIETRELEERQVEHNPFDTKAGTSTEANIAAQDHEKLVLVVEDNVQMRRYIRRHLANDFRLIEAEDGEEGLALAMQSVPDLILSDLMMPKMSGLELAEKIRESEPTSHIPFILLTSSADTNLKLTSYKHGIDDYITKPFDAAQLVARINNRIALRDSLKQHFQRPNQSQNPSTEHDHTEPSVADNDQATAPNISAPSFENILKTEHSFLQRFDAYVLDNITLANLRISAIAEHFHMSERSLSRKLNAIAGSSPKQYLISIRLKQAETLLTSSELSLKEIVANAGFNDSAHFSRVFKAHYGLTPSNYREQHSVKLRR